MYPVVHHKPDSTESFDRLEMLWLRYPQYHEMTCFSTLDELLEAHESYGKDFEDLREEYISGQYERFLIQLSWADLAYRYATKGLLERAPAFPENAYVSRFMEQFTGIDTDTAVGLRNTLELLIREGIFAGKGAEERFMGLSPAYTQNR